MPKAKRIVADTPEALAKALGLSASDAREWQFQHELLMRLKAAVKKENITHAGLAGRTGTSRARVTGILNGNLEHVSSDLLIRLLTGLGYRVHVRISKTAD